MKNLDAASEPLSLLGDDLRRRIYVFVRKEPGPVSREEVASQLGISRKLAAFHLDKLSDAGLLDFSFARPPGRSGPGAGRPAKRYRPSDAEFGVSVPERSYELAGKLLVEGIMDAPENDFGRQRIVDAAARQGSKTGREIRKAVGPRRPGPERSLFVAEEALADSGYEPAWLDGEVVLRNCPFHALAQQSPDLVCGMNLAMINGMLEGMGSTSVEARLAPTPDLCCVRLRKAGRPPPD